MRWLRLLILMFVPVLSYGQGARFQSNASTTVSINGTMVLKPLPNAAVYVYSDPNGSSQATIYSDAALTMPISQPLIADAQGNFGFWTSAQVFYYRSCPAAAPCTMPIYPGSITYATTSFAGVVATTPGATQTINQPSGTTLAVNSLNNVLEATKFTGSDIGAKVNAAIAALGTICGHITVAPGAYTITTTINKPRCVSINFNNATLTSTMTGNKAVIVTGTETAADSHVYQLGKIENLRLIGPGNTSTGTVGIWIGGDPNGVYASSSMEDYLDTFYNVNVQAFESGMTSGAVYQDSFYTVALSSNKWGFHVQNASENMNMYGVEMINNSTYGFYAPNMPAGEFTCTACSIDYNGIGQAGTAGIYIMNGTFNLIGGHMEQCGGYFIDGPVTTSAAMQMNIMGVTFVAFGSASPSAGCPAFGTDTAYIHVTGNNSYLNIGKGVELIRFHPFTTFINWEATGASSGLHVDPYSDPLNNPGLPAIPTAQANNIAALDIPLYDQYVSTNQYHRDITVGQTAGGGFPDKGSIFATNFLGSGANTAGVVPPVSKFPYAGGYFSWNATNGGDVDFLSPYSAASSSTDAYGFYVNYGSGFVKIASIARDGSWVGNGAQFTKGNIQIGVTGSASSVFTFAAAPTGACTTGDIGMNRSGTPNSLYVCQSGAWVGK